MKFVDPSGQFEEDEIKGMGINKENVSQLLYDLLIHAQLENKLTVSYKDGTTKDFYFKNDQQFIGWDIGGGINLVSEEGKSVNIVDTLEDENITEINRYFKRPFPGKGDTLFHPEFSEDYRLEESYFVEGNRFCPVHGLGYPYTDKRDIIYLADAFYTCADFMESIVSPGLSNLPPEYAYAVAGIAGLAGPEATLAVLGFYYAVTWGPSGLRELGNIFDPR